MKPFCVDGVLRGTYRTEEEEDVKGDEAVGYGMKREEEGRDRESGE